MLRQASYESRRRQSERLDASNSVNDVQRQRRAADEHRTTPSSLSSSSSSSLAQSQQPHQRPASASGYYQQPKTYLSAAASTATLPRVQPHHHPVKYVAATPPGHTSRTQNSATRLQVLRFSVFADFYARQLCCSAYLAPCVCLSVFHKMHCG